MTHDKFCMMYESTEKLDELFYCDCSWIKDIRADEREQATQRILAAKEHLQTMPVTVSPAWSVWETQVIDACASAARGGEQA